MGRVKTIWEPCVFGARPSVPLLRVANGAIWFSKERDWSQRVLPWKQLRRCHPVFFVMYISGAKFEEHCSSVSGDILDSVFKVVL